MTLKTLLLALLVASLGGCAGMTLNLAYTDEKDRTYQIGVTLPAAPVKLPPAQGLKK